MSDPGPLALDVVIFGGGAAGLWLLDELVRRDQRVVLLEAGALGHGQTIASQGIIHGGMKYALGGLATPSARAIREMPLVWRRCLGGERAPDLTRTRIRSEFCYLWQTTGWSSRIGMAGARVALQVTPTTLERHARPAVLAECPGDVCRLDEQVIEPASFLEDLAGQHRPRILQIDAAGGLAFDTDRPGMVTAIRLVSQGRERTLRPRHVVFTAGAGNAELRRAVGLENDPAQHRPLHMVLARGDLPALNGHCVDGGRTRLTVTSTRDCQDRTVWQLGGQVAEDGVAMDPQPLVGHVRREVEACLPGVDLRGAAWTTYRADRIEARTRGGRRPRTARADRAGNTVTGWPTKLALAPLLARKVMRALDVPTDDPGPIAPSDRLDDGLDVFRDWPRPAVALPPWETEQRWTVEH